MKTRYISIFVLFLSGTLAFTSCLKDLDTIPLDENVITSATFYNDPASYEMVLAKLYGGLALTGQVGPDGDQDVLGVDEGASNYIRAFWYMQDITTEMALWVWNDPGIPEMQTNTWTPSNEVNLGMYSRIYYQITLANELIRESTPEKLNERGFSENIKSEIALYQAEARLLRALSYYHALDLYGSVPFVTEEDPVGAFLPEQISKADLFNYIEAELLDLENILMEPLTNVYGRIDRAAAWMLLAIATDYKQQYPEYKSDIDPSESTRQIIEEASLLGYNQLRERHMNDYRELYSRVELQIEGNTAAEAKPTNERWEAINNGEPDPGIKVLAFNLGRYMIISSSRPGTLPANLQGVWNVFRIPPWSGNYQSNINLQQIYWSCGPTGLTECHEPYIDWIEDLAISGREIAARVYGTDGWVSHTTGNIWGHAAPIGGMSWGLYPMGSAWHCHHLWEQYSFNQDKEYLREVAYPLLKDAAIFYLQNLRNYENSLVFAPSVSAEHGVYNNEGTLTGVSSSAALGDIKQDDILFNLPAPSQDAQMIWDLFTNTLEAGKILDTDAEFLVTLREKRDSLPSLQVGRYGQLKEWDWDIVDTNNRHRHISHLYAVSPGRQINPLTDIDLAQAAKIALNMRRDGRFLNDDPASGGNWSIAHRMWAWVRLLDGERANDILDLMLTEQGFENLLTYQHDAYHWERRDLDNVGDSLYLHFQLDGSASVPGLLAEMLLQSHHGGIHLLPALPKELQTGSVKGLHARGGYTVNLDWAYGKLTSATIVSQDESIPEILLSGTKVDHEKDKRIRLVFP